MLLQQFRVQTVRVTFPHALQCFLRELICAVREQYFIRKPIINYYKKLIREVNKTPQINMQYYFQKNIQKLVLKLKHC